MSKPYIGIIIGYFVGIAVGKTICSDPALPPPPSSPHVEFIVPDASPVCGDCASNHVELDSLEDVLLRSR